MIIKILKNKKTELLCAFVMFVYFLPLFFPNSAKYLIHDNLDSNVVWYKNMAESGKMFSSSNTLLDISMQGIPRGCYPSEWNFYRILFLIFTPQTAYALNYILMHLIAFIGMRMLLKKHITIDKEPVIYNGVALIYSVLPFWPSGEWTVAGLPLLTYSLLNIFKHKQSYLDWVIIVVFPLFSSLIFGNLFSFPLLFLIFVGGIFFKKWTLSLRPFIAFGLLLIFSLLVDYRLIDMTTSGFVSNRIAESVSTNDLNLKGVIGTGVLGFFFGHYHFHSLHTLIALFAIIASAYFFIKKMNKEFRIVLSVLAAVYLTVFVIVLFGNTDLTKIFGQGYQRINLRLWAVLPIVWYVIFAWLLLKINIANIFKNMLLVAQFLIVFLLLYPRDYYGARFTENIFANTYLYSDNDEQDRWNDYYNVEILKPVKDLVGNDLVATINVLPEKLQYNNIKTLEAYFPFYPLQKWKLIQSIDIEERENDNKSNKGAFTNRNFLYASKENISNQLIPRWNYNLLKKYGVQYVVSERALKLNENSVLTPIFTEDSKIFIYRIN